MDMSRVLLLVLLSSYVQYGALEDHWLPCVDRQCTTPDNKKIQAIKFDLNNTGNLNYRITWKLEYNLQDWVEITGASFSFNSKGDLLTPACGGSTTYSGSTALQVTFGIPVIQFKLILGNRNTQINTTLTKCRPDIKFVNVIQRVSLLPALDFSRIIMTKGSCDRSTVDSKHGPKCITYDNNTFEISYSLPYEYFTNVDKLRFSLFKRSDGDFQKMYGIKIENGDMMPIAQCLLETSPTSQSQKISQCNPGNCTVLFEATASAVKITVGKDIGDTTYGPVFTCGRLCDTDECDMTDYHVIVKILLRDAVYDLQMIQVDKSCPADMRWDDTAGCLCEAPNSYYNYTACTACIAGEECTPPAKLKTQNYFVPDKNRDNDEILINNNELDYIPAICQLDEVDAIKDAITEEDLTEYYLTLKDTSDDLLCKVKINRTGLWLMNADELVGELENEETVDCTTGDPGDNDYRVKLYNDSSVLRLYAKMENTALTCKFSKKGAEEGDVPEVIDTKYLYMESFDLLMTGSQSNDVNAPTYEVMDLSFECRFRGNTFKTVTVSSDNSTVDDLSDNMQHNFDINLQKGDTKSVTCTFAISADDNDNVLEGTTVTLIRPDVQLYKCRAGYELTSGQCVACEAGSYKEEGESSCSACSDIDDQKYAPAIASTKCEDCVNGKVENNRCDVCPPGQKVYDGSCKPCEAGTYYSNSECVPCDVFQYSHVGWTECRECAAGSQASQGRTECEICPAGQYKGSAMNECTSCQEGDWTPYDGSTECKLCEGKVAENRTRCQPVIEGLCSANEYTETPAIGTIVFETTTAGETAKVDCPYNNDGISKVTRVCRDNGTWEEPDISACYSEQTEELEQREITNIDNVNELINDTAKDKIGSQDVKVLVEKFSDPKILIEEIYSEENPNVEDFTGKSLSVMSNLMEASAAPNIEQDLKNSVVDTTEGIIEEVLGRLSDSDDDEPYVFETEMVNVTMMKNIKTSIKFGSGWLVPASDNSNIRDIAASVYKDASLFNSDMGDNTISGNVVGLKHIKKDSSKSAIQFELIFSKIEIAEDNDNSKSVIRQCKWYDNSTNTWSGNGCKTSFDESDNVVCDCDHMTSFAVILSVHPNTTVEWLSDLVLAVNIFFCMLTLLCTLPFRTFRVRKMTIIQSHSILSLIMLCVCWYLMHLNFESDARTNVACQIVAFAAHYFLMCTFSWTFCCTLTLKIQIVDAVKSFGKKNKSLVKKCMLFSYGFPLLLPTLAIIMNILYAQGTAEEISYIRSANECWYASVYMYSLILFPIYVFWGINFVSFIRIMRVVGNARRGADGNREWRVVKAGLALAFTQGLPWIIQPGVIDETNAAMVFQYLFLITFGLQGVGMFVFNVLFQEEVLKNLCGLLHVKPPQIFLSVVPKRHSPHTGDTSVNTVSRNSTNSDNKGYSNNIPMNSVSAVDKSIYQDSTYYNELHESSIVTENRYDQIAEDFKERETSKTSKSELFVNVKDRESPFNNLKFVGNNRVYVENGPKSPNLGASPQPKTPTEHRGPPFL